MIVYQLNTNNFMYLVYSVLSRLNKSIIQLIKCVTSKNVHPFSSHILRDLRRWIQQIQVVIEEVGVLLLDLVVIDSDAVAERHLIADARGAGIEHLVGRAVYVRIRVLDYGQKLWIHHGTAGSGAVLIGQATRV